MASDKGAAGMGMALPIDPLTTSIVRPRDIFAALLVRDDALRAAGIETVFERLRHYEAVADTDPTGNARGTLMVLLPTVLRLTYECPFEDIARACAAYLEHLAKERGILLPRPAPGSVFISAPELPRRDSPDPKIRRACEVSFFTYGRVSNLSHVLLYHPAYLECMLQTFSVVLHDEGPLPQAWRAYIAVMACARHRCMYMLQRQTDAYLECGGDPEWVRLGLACPSLPPKLAALAELNALLAHRPWFITPAHIRDLTQGTAGAPAAAAVSGGAAAGGVSGQTSAEGATGGHSASASNGGCSASGGAGGAAGASWSLNELVHAIVILSTFHSLCSLSLAIGITREPDNGVMTGQHPVKPIDTRSQPIPAHLRSAFGLEPATAAAEAAAAGVSSDAAASAAGASAGEGADAGAAGRRAGSPAAPLPSAASNGSLASSASGRGAGPRAPPATPSAVASRLLYSARAVAAGERELRSRLLAATQNEGALEELGQLQDEEEEDAGAAGGSSRDTASSGAAGTAAGDVSGTVGVAGTGDASAAAAAGGSAAGALPEQAALAGTNAKRRTEGASEAGPAEAAQRQTSVGSGSGASADDAARSVSGSDDDEEDDEDEEEEGGGWNLAAGSSSSRSGRSGTSAAQAGDGGAGVTTRSATAAGSDAVVDSRAGLSVAGSGGRRPRVSDGSGSSADGPSSAGRSGRGSRGASSGAGSGSEDGGEDDEGDEEDEDGDEDEDDDEEAQENFERAGAGAAIDIAAAAAAAAAAYTMTLDADAEAAGVLAASGGDVGVGVTASARSRSQAFLGSGPLTHTPDVSVAARMHAKAAKLQRKQQEKQLHQRGDSSAGAGSGSSGASATVGGCAAVGSGTLEDDDERRADAGLTSATRRGSRDSSSMPGDGAGGAVAAAAVGASGAGGSGSGAAAGSAGGDNVADLMYRDFDTSEGMFVTHDFSWEEHAYALLQRFFPAAAPVLDKQFHLTFSLTYRTFGGSDRDVNTEPFRSAVWFYVQRLYGVRNDHYDYALVNKLMPRPTKTFVKKVACYPEITTILDFTTFTETFTPAERVHIVMLVCEARRQASLLYALRAVLRHMTCT